MRTLPILLAMILLSGCSLLPSRSSSRIDAPSRYKPQLYGDLNEAERRSELSYRGPTIKVALKPGLVMSADPPWLGHRVTFEGRSGVATGVARSDYTVTLYTTNGLYRPATGIHEMAHMVYFSHGVPIGEHHARMRRVGIQMLEPFCVWDPPAEGWQGSAAFDEHYKADTTPEHDGEDWIGGR